MKIEILGTGCYQCVRLESLIADVLIELEIQEADLTRVSEEQAIRRWMPLDALPGLVINRVLASMGRLPAREELVSWLRAAAQPAPAG